MSVQRKTILLAAVGFSTVVVGVAVLGPQGLPQLRRLSNEAGRLSKQNTALEAENAQLRTDIEALRSSPRMQEKVVREELGYVKPGEQLWTVTPATDASAPAAPAPQAASQGTP